VAGYVCAVRMWGIAKTGWRVLRRRIAARMLLRAIRRNAWTFAGSGVCAITTGPALAVYIVDNPLPTPGCAWHRAVFERLFQRLVDPNARVRHTACVREGAAACRFEIDLPTRRGSPA